MADLKEYRIVIGKDATFNERRAAEFLRREIRIVMGAVLPVVSDEEPPVPYELVVGRTAREQSENVRFSRSPDRLWEYELRFVDGRLFLTGLGEAPTEQEPFNSYRLIQDGAYGTVYAAYRFAETVLHDAFLFATYDGFRSLVHAEIDASCNFCYTKERLRAEMPRLLPGAAIYSIPSCEILRLNMSCWIIKTRFGKLIVIDGGHYADCEHVLACLRHISGEQRPRVTAWLFSHLHEDHYGVFHAIVQSPQYCEQIRVDHVYEGLLPEKYYTEECTERFDGEEKVIRAILSADETLGATVHHVRTGDRITVDEIGFDVLHVPDLKDGPEMNLNDTGVVYKMTYDGGQTVLFLSDAEKVCSRDLLENHRAELKSDVVQAGHHGCGNVSKECYREIGARLCIFQVGERFWYGDNGEGLNTHNVGVIRTRAYLKELGMETKNILRDTDGILSMPLPIPIPYDAQS